MSMLMLWQWGCLAYRFHNQSGEKWCCIGDETSAWNVKTAAHSEKRTLSRHAVIRLCRDKGTQHVANHQPPGNFIEQHCFKRIVCRFASISNSAPLSWLTNSFFSQLLLKLSIVMLPSVPKSISFYVQIFQTFQRGTNLILRKGMKLYPNMEPLGLQG